MTSIFSSDPRRRQRSIDGAMAERLVWSTRAIMLDTSAQRSSRSGSQKCQYCPGNRGRRSDLSRRPSVPVGDSNDYRAHAAGRGAYGSDRISENRSNCRHSIRCLRALSQGGSLAARAASGANVLNAHTIELILALEKFGVIRFRARRYRCVLGGAALSPMVSAISDRSMV